MKKSGKSQTAFSALKAQYVLTAASSFFVYTFFMFKEGIDGSWVYAINRFFSEGLLWGRNIIFTYGPLGFILMLWSVGNNAVYSLAFWTVILILTVCMMSYILFSERMNRFNDLNTRKDNIFMSFLMFYLSVPLSLSALSPEYVSQFIVLYLLSVCYVNHDTKFFVIASVISVASAFMKFNSGVSDFATLFVFAVIMIMQYRTFRYMYMFMLSVFAFVLCFMIYNPSLSELYYYVRGAYEISSGYISAMSDLGPNRGGIFAVFLVIGIASFIAVMFMFKFEGGFFNGFQVYYALIFLPGIVMALKHTLLMNGFSYDVGRILIPSLLIYVSIWLIFTDQTVIIRPKLRKILSAGVIAFFAFTFIISALGLNTQKFIGKQFVADALTNPVFRIYDRFRLSEENNENQFFILPDEFMQIISNDTVTIYPWELSFAKHIPNFRNMPVIQAYSAYTSWLDELNADFFNEEARAPKYIIFSVEAVFERYPLIECPSTWLAIFRNYSIRDYRDKYFLLERLEKSDRKNFTAKDLGAVKCNKNDVILLPEAQSLIAMKLDVKLSFLGKLAKIFFRIPRVDMIIEYSDGRKSTGRVLIETLGNQAIISNVILNDEDFTRFMDGDKNTGKVKSLKLTGDGLKYYSDEIAITFTELEQ